MMGRNKRSYLDRMRLRQGNDALRQRFSEMAIRDRQKTLQYINDEKLQYPCLFVLKPELDAMDLYTSLIPRNAIALDVHVKKIINQIQPVYADQPGSQDNKGTYEALRWMFSTGATWEAPNEDKDTYDTGMDAAASILVTEYNDISILPIVVNLIFQRNRRGLLIHDLVWCFYQACVPNSYMLIAEYLLSHNLNDVELACKLLHLQLPENLDMNKAKRDIYKEYTLWLEVNDPFLYYTGDSFQLTSEPDPLQIDLEAKYLNRKVSPRRGKVSLESQNENEIRCLQRFRECSEYEKRMLSVFSLYMHNRDERKWNEWIAMHFDDQLYIATSGLETIYDYRK